MKKWGKKQALHLMRAFLNTCSKIYVGKTAASVSSFCIVAFKLKDTMKTYFCYHYTLF